MARRAWLRPGTMRARTTVAACTVVGVALLAGAAGLLALMHHSLVANIDAGAAGRAADIAAQAAQGPLPATLAVRGGEDALIQVVDASGRVVAASDNLQGQAPITTLRPGRGGPTAARSTTHRSGKGQQFRVPALSAPSKSGPLTIYVASGLGATRESIAAVRGILLVGLPLLLGVVGVTTWTIVGRALRPVEAIRAEVADLSVRDLSRRVPEPGMDDEIGRLAGTMNDMLDRLQSSAERQRRFIGDASHELQSPLAAGRTELEVALAHPEKADWPVTAAGLLEENERMTRLVQDLLFLARAEEGTAARPMSPVDLDDVVVAEVDRARLSARVPIDISGVSGAEVRGRTDDLGRVLRNLLGNADRHARTNVTVTLGRVGDMVELVVADDGPGVPESERDRVFERFRRLDETRSRETGGTGLGLAIAREVVIAHGGSIAVESAEPGARFVARFPGT
ncbi:MAG: ATP-binding protein [Actinomycetota bacterium]|nr:ATP-binding protein [Actinomycetota bacterium]